MFANVRESKGKAVVVEKNDVKKEYSADALSVTAVVNARKTVSTYAGDFISRATCEGKAAWAERLRISRRRPRNSGFGDL